MLVRVDGELLASSDDREKACGSVWVSRRVVGATYQKGQPKMDLERLVSFKTANVTVRNLVGPLVVVAVYACYHPYRQS